MNNVNINNKLPGLDCGLCGLRTCSQFSEVINEKPENIVKCVHLSNDKTEIYKTNINEDEGKHN